MTTLSITIEGPSEAVEEKFKKLFCEWMCEQGEQDWLYCEEEHLRGYRTEFTYPEGGIYATVKKEVERS